MREARIVGISLSVFIAVLAIAMVMRSDEACAATWRVEDIDDLVEVQANMSDGDVVMVEPGWYERFVVNRSVEVRGGGTGIVNLEELVVLSANVVIRDIHIATYFHGIAVLHSANVSVSNVTLDVSPEYGPRPAMWIAESPGLGLYNTVVRSELGSALVIEGTPEVGIVGCTLVSGGAVCLEALSGSRILASSSSFVAQVGIAVVASEDATVQLNGCYILGGSSVGALYGTVEVVDAVDRPPSGDLPPVLLTPIGDEGFIIYGNSSNYYDEPRPDTLLGVLLEDHFLDEWPMYAFRVVHCSLGMEDEFYWDPDVGLRIIEEFHALRDVGTIQVEAIDWLGQRTLSNEFNVTFVRTDDPPRVYASGFTGSGDEPPPNPVNVTINASDDVRLEKLWYAVGKWNRDEPLVWTEVALDVGFRASINVSIEHPGDKRQVDIFYFRASDGVHESTDSLHLFWPSLDRGDIVVRTHTSRGPTLGGALLMFLGIVLLLWQLVAARIDRRKGGTNIKYLKLNASRSYTVVAFVLLITGAATVLWGLSRWDEFQEYSPEARRLSLGLGSCAIGVLLALSTHIRWRRLYPLRSRTVMRNSAAWSVISFSFLLIGLAFLLSSTITSAVFLLVVFYTSLIIILDRWPPLPFNQDPLRRLVLAAASQNVETVRDGHTSRPFRASVRLSFDEQGFKGEVEGFARFLADHGLLVGFDLAEDSAHLMLSSRPISGFPLLGIWASRKAIDVRIGSDGSCNVIIPRELYDEFAHPVSFHELCEGVGELLKRMHDEFRRNEPTKALMHLYPRSVVITSLLILVFASMMMCLAGMSQDVAGETFHVDHTDTYGLQDVVDLAGPGDEVIIEPGEYYGTILIDKPLTVRGVEGDLYGARINIRGGASGLGYPWLPYLGSPGIIITSPNVTLEHLQIWRATTGVLVWEARDVRINGLKIYEVSSSYAPESRTPIDGFGVSVIGCERVSITSTKVYRSGRSVLDSNFNATSDDYDDLSASFGGGIYVEGSSAIDVRWTYLDTCGVPQLRARGCIDVSVYECAFEREYSSPTILFENCSGVHIVNCSFMCESVDGPLLENRDGGEIVAMGVYWAGLVGTGLEGHLIGDVQHEDDNEQDPLEAAYPRLRRPLPAEIHLNESESRVLFDPREYIEDPFQQSYYLRNVEGPSDDIGYWIDKGLWVRTTHAVGAFEFNLTVTDFFWRERAWPLRIVVDPVYDPPQLKASDEGELELPEADWDRLMLEYIFSGTGGGPLPTAVDGDEYRRSFWGRFYTDTPEAVVEYRVDGGKWRQATIVETENWTSYAEHRWKFYYEFTRKRDDGVERVFEIRGLDGTGNMSQVVTLKVVCDFAYRPDQDVEVGFLTPLIAVWAVSSVGIYRWLTRGTVRSPVDWKALNKHVEEQRKKGI